MPPPPPDLGVVICVERGVLEAQAILLCESLRRFGGRYRDAPVYAVAPRAGRRPGRATVRALERLDVDFVERRLNTECAEYGSANRLAAAAYVEGLGRHRTLAVLDSDTLFVAEPAAFELAPEVVAAVRPVDVKGMCTAGPGDPKDDYWRRLAACCGVDYDALPFVRTTVGGERVKASYNGGLVVARADHGLLERWWAFFLASARAGLRPWREPPRVRSSTGFVPAEASLWWGSNQAALALALWSSTRAVLELAPGYNYPLHLHAELSPTARADAFDALVHLHYHYLFDPDALADNPLLGPRSPLAHDDLAWLRARVPLRPPARLAAGLDLAAAVRRWRFARRRPLAAST